ncbi:MAG: hypothetical protein AB1791_08190 [Chloroflexota bacterium]
MSDFKSAFIGNGLYCLSRLTGRTGRYQVSGIDHFHECRAAGRPVILAAWHGMTMMLASYFIGHFDPGSFVLLLPDDERGRNLSVWARKLGAHPFCLHLEGDSSLASARQLVNLVRLVKGGRDCYITPDGPDGPAYRIKPGVAYIAQKAQAAILPVGAYTRTGYRLNRWDQYTIPRPFSRIALVIGEPLQAPAGGEATALIGQLTAALHQVTAQAAANYYEMR